jgi:hypothetical protein
MVPRGRCQKPKKADAGEIRLTDAAITKLPSNLDMARMTREELKKANDVSFVAEIEGKVVG